MIPYVPFVERKINLLFAVLLTFDVVACGNYRFDKSFIPTEFARKSAESLAWLL